MSVGRSIPGCARAGPLPEVLACSSGGVGESPIGLLHVGTLILRRGSLDRAHTRFTRLNRVEEGGGQWGREGGKPTGRGVKSAHARLLSSPCIAPQGNTTPARSGRANKERGCEANVDQIHCLVLLFVGTKKPSYSWRIHEPRIVNTIYTV